jgi:hypothetical protein
MIEESEAAVRVAELRKELAAQRRLKQLRQSYGLNFYKPHYKQDLFHSNVTRRVVQSVW